MSDMDGLRILAETRGFFTRPMAAEFGYTTRSFDAAFRSGAWHRFRHGYYTMPDLWEGLDEPGRHRVRCRAVLHSLGSGAVLSHVSSLVMQGIEPWGQDLSRVHVTRLDGVAGRIERDVVHHVGRLSESDLVEARGALVVRPARAAIEAATTRGGEVALCLFNQVLHGELADDQELWEAASSMQLWPGMLAVHVPLRMADRRCESVGESRGFWLFRTHHIPAPEPQFEVYDEDGVLLGTTDWGWPAHGLLGEFDGYIKYGRLLQPGQEPGPVVFAEKQREDLIREVTDMRFVRLIWDDYQRPRNTAARIERMLRRAA